jgi:hypothetical protein
MADIIGKAIRDFREGDQDAFLLVHTSYGEIETMPAYYLFQRLYANAGSGKIRLISLQKSLYWMQEPEPAAILWCYKPWVWM